MVWKKYLLEEIVRWNKRRQEIASKKARGKARFENYLGGKINRASGLLFFR